jgi:hypothetical protein
VDVRVKPGSFRVEGDVAGQRASMRSQQNRWAES